MSSSKWFGERVPGQETNYQKTVKIFEDFTHYPLIFRIGRTVYGAGIFKITVSEAQIQHIEQHVRQSLSAQIPAFKRIQVKTDKSFGLLSFQAKIVKPKNS